MIKNTIYNINETAESQKRYATNISKLKQVMREVHSKYERRYTFNDLWENIEYLVYTKIMDDGGFLDTKEILMYGMAAMNVYDKTFVTKLCVALLRKYGAANDPSRYKRVKEHMKLIYDNNFDRHHNRDDDSDSGSGSDSSGSDSDGMINARITSDYHCDKRCSVKCIDESIDNLGEIVTSCSRVFRSIKLIKEIGRGAYGIVYNGAGTLKDNKSTTMDIIIKFVYQEEDIVDYLIEEVEYSYFMGKQHLGPEVYDAFYITEDKGDTQVIIMEYFPMDANTFLSNSKNEREIRSVLEKMVGILKRSIYDHNMYCVDIKPENFVTDGYDVRMIDFGSIFCRPGDELPTDTVDDLYQVLLFQLFTMIGDTFTDTKKSDRLKEQFKKIFCSQFEDDITNIVKKYYYYKSLSLKHYIDNETILNYTFDQICN